ncbi:hypothetical protein GMLC_12110 [Geomonas limicola]|uniref:DUF4276 domain-containing protein n=1 Tax=Geomonas limicola TaxID=2740186 RepID=A0A6V8N4Y7_9BACT|nr:DUF4276 family protein [Geomonas limicola]GFO67632.1 hypothetical protein GMLC_12110 [Geomonas limicola]
MKRVLVLVEGQTEERFVKDVLGPYFASKNLFLFPTVAKTKRVKCGADFKGGITGFSNVAKDLKQLIKDQNAFVTTFIDYYGLPSDFPGMNSLPNGSPLIKVCHVETALAQFINCPRFKPFIMLHEFEALLYTNPSELCRALHADHKILATFMGICNAYQNPEEINNSPSTAPSKRILNLVPGYQKTLHGPTITRRIGLDTLRQNCPHFDDWLVWLESL